jgi:hypothetical protein
MSGADALAHGIELNGSLPLGLQLPVPSVLILMDTGGGNEMRTSLACRVTNNQVARRQSLKQRAHPRRGPDSPKLCLREFRIALYGGENGTLLGVNKTCSI